MASIAKHDLAVNFNTTGLEVLQILFWSFRPAFLIPVLGLWRITNEEYILLI